MLGSNQLWGIDWLQVWNYFSPVVSGIITALAWAVMVWVFTYFRNKTIRKAIKESVSNMRAGNSINSVYISIHNNTPYDFVIKEVALLYVRKNNPEPQKECKLFLGNLTSIHSGDENFSHGEVDLKHYSSGCWGVRVLKIHNNPSFKSVEFVEFKIKIEYLNLFKTPKIIEVNIGENDKYSLMSFNMALKEGPSWFKKQIPIQSKNQQKAILVSEQHKL